jgi:hypothetical protein
LFSLARAGEEDLASAIAIGMAFKEQVIFNPSTCGDITRKPHFF